MPLSRPAARHSLMLSRSYGGRVCGDVACFWPALTRLLSVPCLGHKNRTRGAAQGPSKPRNRQMSQPCSPRAGPSRHDVSNMRGFDSYRLLTLSLAALMARVSSVEIDGAHTSAGAATLARTVPFWGRFRSPREPTAGPCRGCLLPSATNTAPSRHHLQAVLCDGWDVQTPPSWLLRPQTRELYGWS